MPDTYTPYYGLTLPEIGASRDTWGTKWNQNLAQLDELIFWAMPVGSILDYAGPNPPPGWLIADGRLVSRTTYSALFAVIGTAWGAGDGSTTFALPNLIGRSGVGPGNMIDQSGQGYTFTFGHVAGSVAYQIGQQHLPNYAIYTDAQGSHSHNGLTTIETANHYHTTDTQGSHTHGGATGYMSADHTHTGYTDSQGSHYHNVYTPYGSGGGGGGGGFSVTGQGGFGGYTDTQGAHTHAIQTYGSSANHTHAIGADGAHAHTTGTESAYHQHGISADGSHAHTIYLGGSSAWFETLPPVVVVTKIIYATWQAASRATADAAATSQIGHETDERDELALIREQLAELRALLAPPGRPQHLMRAPMRGVH